MIIHTFIIMYYYDFDFNTRDMAFSNPLIYVNINFTRIFL